MRQQKLRKFVLICTITAIFAGIIMIITEKDNSQPRLFLLKNEYLEITKELWQKKDIRIVPPMRILIQKAKTALKKGPYSVTFKKNLPPSGDKRDFVAYLAHAWPNPNTPDGLPWIFRDGYNNPDARLDWNQFEPMARDSYVLSLAYYFTGEKIYAKHAAKLLRTWFINQKTRMNPNANYGKSFPGVTEGGYPVAGFGYIFRQIYDAAGILEMSSYWTKKDREGLKKWTKQFMQWVENSKHGKTEFKRDSNHGTFYDMNMAIQALYINDKDKARQVINSYIQNRLPKQFSPDGKQPFEMIRTNNYDYHRCNLMVAFDIAQLADHFKEIDLWNYQTPDKAGLKSSTNFLVPYLIEKKKWTYFKKEKFKISGQLRWQLLQRAALGFKDKKYDKALMKIKEFHLPSIMHLVYPRLAKTL